MPLEVRLAYLPAPILPWLMAVVLFVLSVAAWLHWKRSRQGYLAVFAASACLSFIACVLSRINALALQGKSFEEMATIVKTPFCEWLANAGLGLGVLSVAGACVASIWILVDAIRRRA
jgi:hypothetical protein